MFADILESWPTEILKRLDPAGNFLSDNQEAKAAPIASETGSVRFTGSPSTPATATPRISLYIAINYTNRFLTRHVKILHDTRLSSIICKMIKTRLMFWYSKIGPNQWARNKNCGDILSCY